MKIIKSLQNWLAHGPTAVTIGTFDGVHRGHEKIVKATVQAGRHIQGQSVVITFQPHPQHVLRPQEPLSLISSLDEKGECLERLGLDTMLIMSFNKTLASLSPEDFVRDILVGSLQVKHLIVGFNHAFGRKREGHEDNLRELGVRYGFDVSVIPPVLCTEGPISSTRVRKALLAGDVSCAAEMLQRPYSLLGRVGKGAGIGREMGFPTANIQPDSANKLMPADGVYAVRVEHGETLYNGMANIGQSPTVNGKERRLEVHLFDFSADIYNERIRVHFIERIRNEERFNSREVLKAQIQRDQISSLGLLNKTQF